MNDYKNKISRKDIDEMSKKIMGWLSDDGRDVKKALDDSTYFNYGCEFVKNSSRFFEVWQPKDRADLIVMGCFLNIPKNYQKVLKGMKDKERMAFFKSIQFAFMFRPISYDILPTVQNAERFEFMIPLYYDGLNKNVFMDSIRLLERCTFFTNIMLDALSEPAGVEVPDPMIA